MIHVSISELKNRLSHYLRLVRGGEEIEILDRDTPVGRIVHVARQKADKQRASWVKEVQRQGIVSAPEGERFSEEFLSTGSVPASEKREAGVLDALLEERNAGL